MSTLLGRSPADTYHMLLSVEGGVTSTLTIVQGGNGTTTPFKLSTAEARFSCQLSVGSLIAVSGNLDLYAATGGATIVCHNPVTADVITVTTLTATNLNFTNLTVTGTGTFGGLLTANGGIDFSGGMTGPGAFAVTGLGTVTANNLAVVLAATVGTNLQVTSGHVNVRGAAAADTSLTAHTGGADQAGMVITRHASQTANLLEFRDSDGTTVLQYFDKDGVFSGGGGGGGITIGDAVSGGAPGFYLYVDGSGNLGQDVLTAADVGLGSVENTALSTWTGSTNLVTLGTVTTGTWHGTAVAISYGGTGQTTQTAAFDALSPFTTLGDTLYGGASGTGTRLAGNTTTTRKFLRQTGNGSISAAPAWDTVTSTDVGLGSVENTALSTWAGTTNLVTLGTVTTGTWHGTTIGIAYGGTGQTTAADAINALVPSQTGNNGKFLTTDGSVVSWGTAGGGGGGGTVTSVDMTVPSILSVSGNPITSSGTLAVTLATQNANIVFAGPSSGGAATPTFRSLAAADFPTAMVAGSTAAGTNALGVGNTNTAAGNYGTAVGYKNSMNSASLNCHLVGGYNFGTSTSFATVAFGLLNNQQSGSLNTSTGAITGTPAAAATVGRICTAVGTLNRTTANFGTALGYNNLASGVAGTALGYSNTASGLYSTAAGYSNTASGATSLAIGKSNTASNNTDIAVGTANTASGTWSTAAGYKNTASGLYSTAAGYRNTASGSKASAMGQKNTAAGAGGSAVGYINAAAGNNSSAVGYSNSMNSASLNCHLVGGYNFGTSASFATVAFGLLNNQVSGTLSTATGAITGTPAAAGTVGRLCTAVGILNTTSANLATALGYSNTASGYASVAAGYKATASGSYATCFGFNSYASNTSALAVGGLCTASGNTSLALGNNCTASALVAIAIGYGVSNSTANSVDIGADDTSKLSLRDNALLFMTKPVPRVLATVTGIDGLANAATTLYTVPSGRTAIITEIVIRCTAADSVGTPASVTVGTNATSYNDIKGSTTLTSLDATTKAFVISTAGAVVHIATASEVIKINVNGGLGTTLTLAVDLIGYTL